MTRSTLNEISILVNFSEVDNKLYKHCCLALSKPKIFHGKFENISISSLAISENMFESNFKYSRQNQNLNKKSQYFQSLVMPSHKQCRWNFDNISIGSLMFLDGHFQFPEETRIRFLTPIFFILTSIHIENMPLEYGKKIFR